MRLDKYLQLKFNLKSRTYAENLIKTGNVCICGTPVFKPSYEVDDSYDIRIVNDEDYASQGAYKLEAALDTFSVNVCEKQCVDIGCSNGGFTDCLLRHGASSVLAVDVAACALPERLLGDSRVSFMQTNARDLPPTLKDFDFACCDVSFISQKLILGEIFRILHDGGEAVTLVKPQFELNKAALGKNGIVTDEKNRLNALASVKRYCADVGFEILGETMSPRRYEKKNIEYLLYLKKP